MTSLNPSTNYKKNVIHKTSFQTMLRGTEALRSSCITLTGNTITFKQNSNISDDQLKEIWRSISTELNKQRWKRLESLTIEFLECQDLSDEAYQQLRFDQFKNFRNLQALQIKFTKCSISDQGLQNITRNICVGIRNVKKLGIWFSQSESTFEEGLKLMAVQIHKYLVNLRDLSISFYYGSVVNRGITKLGKSIIKNLRELQRLNLTFYSCQVRDESLGMFDTGFNWKLSKMECLKINFAKCSNISDDGVIALSKGMTRCFPNIKNLILNFTTCEKITDVSFKVLTSKINDHWLKLTHLNLLFDDCELVTDAGLKSLSEDVISKSNQLQDLYLSFSSYESITDKGLSSIVQSIDGRQSLKRLGLALFGCSALTNQGFGVLNQEVCGSLRNLQALNLDLSACNIEDSWVTAFSTQLSSNLQSLKELDLRLSFCESITDKSVKHLLKVVTRSLPRLEKLTLNFFECIGIGEEELLAPEDEGEVDLNDLRELHLNYARCSANITDRTLDWLNSHIFKKLPNLKALSLEFSCYENITDVGVNKLALELKENNSQLQQLTLDFTYSAQITKEAEANVKQIVEFVPKQDVRIVA